MSKHPNISASLYDSDFNTVFECVGETVCRHALCSTTLPTEEDRCFFHDHECSCPLAWLDALIALRKRLTKEINAAKEIEE